MKGSAESAAAWGAWEATGRPLQHWLGRALTVAANVPWHRASASGAGAAAAAAIDARVAKATRQGTAHRRVVDPRFLSQTLYPVP